MNNLSRFRTNFMKFLTLVLFLNVLIFKINAHSAYALSSGAYIVPTTTYYVNPETGKVDDKGNGDKALGEAMARSTLDENALLEIENGKNYVTLRLKLISSISNVKIFTQSKRGASYSQAKTTITAENYTEDYADYKLELKDTTSYIGFEFYVAPMGRDVKFYASIDESKAKEGSGNFVSTVKKETKTEQEVKTVFNNIENREEVKNTSENDNSKEAVSSQASLQEQNNNSQNVNTYQENKNNVTTTAIEKKETSNTVSINNSEQTNLNDNSNSSQEIENSEQDDVQKTQNENEQTEILEDSEGESQSQTSEDTEQEEINQEQLEQENLKYYNQNKSNKVSIMNNTSIFNLLSFVIILIIIVFTIIYFSKR